jgi:predicted nucleotidyltransferase
MLFVENMIMVNVDTTVADQMDATLKEKQRVVGVTIFGS